MFFFATLFQILVGLLAPPLLARALHRRDAPYALLLPGAIAGLAVFLIGSLLAGGVAIGLAALPAVLNLPFYSGLLGFLTGLLAAGLITATLVWLAPSARTSSHIAMIGVGYGGAEVVMRAALAGMVLVGNFQLYDRPLDKWNLPPEEAAVRQAEVQAYFEGSPATPLLESVVALGKIALGLAVTLLVGGMFLTGGIGWFFAGWVWAAVGTIGPLMFGRGGPIADAAWWAVAGVISIYLAARRTPKN